MSTERPLVAVSSCLLGERVRYDGGHKLDPWITEMLARRVDLKALCPETAIGMGVPRAPIRLVAQADAVRALGVDDPGFDVTEALSAYAHSVVGELANVCGYIFKSRSPSCGLSDTPLFDSDGREQGLTTGIHARVIREQLSRLPLVDERVLHDEAGRRAFLEQVFAYWRSGQASGARE